MSERSNMGGRSRSTALLVRSDHCFEFFVRYPWGSSAMSGYRKVNMTATDVGSFLGSFWAKGGGSSRQELLVLMEKTVD
jgi:hypothetical protein